MKVCLEATSLRGHRSGVGRSTAELARVLVECDPTLELTLYAMSSSRDGALHEAASQPRTSLRGGNPVARGASWFWARSEVLPAELLCGACDVFHGPNYLLPPLRKAAGVITVFDVAFDRMPQMCSPAVVKLGHAVKRTIRRARRIITASQFSASEIAHFYPELADRIRVVPVGVRDVFFSATPSAAREPYLVFLGNLELRKGVDVLLDAFARVRASMAQARLVLVGNPSVGFADMRAAHASLFGSAVTLAGTLDDEQSASLMAGAKAMVYPSRYEGFGMPPLEAMACGTRVIASNAGPLPEVCGPHATYVDAGNAEALAAAMTHALTTDADPAALSAARDHARTYSWSRTGAETLAVYAEAMEDW
jgi:glycosyltransferase involved in cell wall biosynthesis